MHTWEAHLGWVAGSKRGEVEPYGIVTQTREAEEAARTAFGVGFERALQATDGIPGSVEVELKDLRYQGYAFPSNFVRKMQARAGMPDAD